MLLRYSPYKDFENEMDKSRKLKELMAQNSDNFSVVNEQTKKKYSSNMRSISFVNSMSLARTQSLDTTSAKPHRNSQVGNVVSGGAGSPSKNSSIHQQNNKQEVDNFDGLIEGSNQ